MAIELNCDLVEHNLCTGHTSIIGLRERHRTSDIGGLIAILGHVSWAPQTV